MQRVSASVPVAKFTRIGTLNHLRGVNMDIREGTSDENAIRALIGAHFQGLKWTPTTQAD